MLLGTIVHVGVITVVAFETILIVIDEELKWYEAWFCPLKYALTGNVVILILGSEQNVNQLSTIVGKNINSIFDVSSFNQKVFVVNNV